MLALREGDAKMSKARFFFMYQEEFYLTQQLENYAATATRDDWQALKDEYTRMRDTAQKRLKRLEKSDFSQSKVVTERPGGFPKLSELRQEDIPYAMNDLFRFLRAKTSTVSGQRARMEKTIQTFKEAGINITPKEYPSFIKVLERMRKHKLFYDSEHAKQVTEFMLSSNKFDKRLLTSKKRLKKLLDHANDLDKLSKKVQKHKGKMLAVDMDKALKEIGWLK